jgi:NitT/TauT family transport system substrate-binding protein
MSALFNRWMLLAGALIGLSLIIIAYPYARPKVQAVDDLGTIRVGIVTWPGFAVGFVGKEKHLFRNMDVELQVIADISARRAAFISGKIDIMISSVDGFVQEYAQGLRGKIVLITDESFGGDGLVVKPGVHSIVEMKGKKVAFARATASHYLLYKVLQKAGISPDEIIQVPVNDPENAVQAFLGGSVDAAVSWEPFLTDVRISGRGRILVSSRDFPGIIVDVLVASPKLLENQQLLAAFVRGWLSAVQYTQQHPDESLGIIARELNTKIDDAERQMSGLRLADLGRNQLYLCEPSQKRLFDLISDASTFWKEQGIISDKPSLSDLISAQACKNVQSK